VVAAINLADLYRQLGRETEGEAVLREAVATSPRDAAVHHALGLNLTRQKRPELALAEFQTASQLEPDRAQYPYVYAVALHSAGKVEEAMTVLRRSLANHPNDRSILSALLAFSRTSGDMEAALDYAQRLALVSPDDPNLARMIGELRRAVLPAPREQR
jgi:Flp pilus assembly protein TadD